MEKILDVHVAKNRALGMQEDNILEEATVLDDDQDLMHLGRYQQPTREETAPLAMVQPLQEGWSGPVGVKAPADGPVEWRWRSGLGWALLQCVTPHL